MFGTFRGRAQTRNSIRRPCPTHWLPFRLAISTWLRLAIAKSVVQRRHVAQPVLGELELSELRRLCHDAGIPRGSDRASGFRASGGHGDHARRSGLVALSPPDHCRLSYLRRGNVLHILGTDRLDQAQLTPGASLQPDVEAESRTNGLL